MCVCVKSDGGGSKKFYCLEWGAKCFGPAILPFRSSPPPILLHVTNDLSLTPNTRTNKVKLFGFAFISNINDIF